MCQWWKTTDCLYDYHIIKSGMNVILIGNSDLKVILRVLFIWGTRTE